MLSMNASFQTFLELPPLTPFSPSLPCCFPSLLGDHWAAHLVVVLPSSVGCSQLFCGAPTLCLMLSLMFPLSGWCSHLLGGAPCSVLTPVFLGACAGWLLPQIFLELPHTWLGHGQRSPWAGEDRQWGCLSHSGS